MIEDEDGDDKNDNNNDNIDMMGLGRAVGFRPSRYSIFVSKETKGENITSLSDYTARWYISLINNIQKLISMYFSLFTSTMYHHVLISIHASELLICKKLTAMEICNL